MNNPEHTSLIQEAIQGGNPEVALENVVHQLSGQGYTRSQIYQLFLAYQTANHHTPEWNLIEDEKIDHPVVLILDRLVGWCNSKNALLAEEPLNEKE